MRLSAARAFPVALLGIFLTSSASLGQTKGCLDLPGEPHPYGQFTFVTNSRIDKPLTTGHKSGIISCVIHDDKINFLRVHWMIPGPDGWVPPGGQPLSSLPRDTDITTFKQVPGCLLVGPRGDTTTAQFIGVEGDDARIADEQKRGCRAVVANPHPLPGIIERIFATVRNYVPSDANRANETMLQIEATVGIVPQGTTGFRSVVSYLISRYAGSEGDPSQLSMRPVFPGATERLLPAFLQDHKPPSQLGEKGEIAFSVGDVANPRLDYAAYEIFDREGRPVGSISFPVFVSGFANQ